MGIYKGSISGKLISKLSAVGTKSEGPDYYILPNDEYSKWKEIYINKSVMRWMKDPVLDPLVGETVTIKGEITETRNTITMDYKEVIHNGQVIPRSETNPKGVRSPDEVNKALKDLLNNNFSTDKQ